MQISRRKFLGTTAAAGAAGFGLGVLVDRLAPHFSKKNITQIPKPVDPHDLEQAIQKYNSANLEEKSRILSEMYDGRAKLIPVSYDNQHEMLDGYYGDVWAVIHFGVLQVNGSGSQSGFSLNNTRESVTVDNHGRLRQAYGEILLLQFLMDILCLVLMNKVIGLAWTSYLKA